MQDKGVSFQITSEYGNLLSDLLEPLPYNDYKWLIEYDEIYKLNGEEITDEPLYDKDIYKGQELYEIANKHSYYMIFISLMAFYEAKEPKPIRNYEDYIDSDCQIFVCVSDCSNVMILCKNNNLVLKMHEYALSKGYEKVSFISEKDLINGHCRLS